MLNDLSVFEAEDVKSNLGAEEVVIGVCENKSSVLEYADGVYLGHLREILQAGKGCSETGEAVSYCQVVLAIVICIDVSDGLACAGLDCLQEGSHLLFLCLHDICILSCC